MNGMQGGPGGLGQTHRLFTAAWALSDPSVPTTITLNGIYTNPGKFEVTAQDASGADSQLQRPFLPCRCRIPGRPLTGRRESCGFRPPIRVDHLREAQARSA